MTRRGFPHSDIPGSKLVCSSPRLFAAYRVLHRLLAPRHSPYALSSLTIGMQELTIDARLLRNTRSRQSLFLTLTKNTACVCDYGKNYRLQDIQLRKNIVNDLPSTLAMTSLTAQTCSSTRASSGCGPCSSSWWRIPGSNR
jgi:hypothetical protein